MSLLSLEERLTFGEKLHMLNIGFIFLVFLIFGVGFLSLYSAGGGNIHPWAFNHVIRFTIGFVGMLFVALLDIRFWRKMAYPFYLIVLFLLIAVEVKGYIGMGAQRWINLGFINLQPSELMKAALILALANYYCKRDPEHITNIPSLIVPALLILLPTALVLRQPDLGTAVMLVAVGVTILFLAGIRIWVFLLGGAAVVAACPIAWQFLHDYQKQRVLTFLNPESDPLGSGYHVMQSKIALGSAGMSGKGFLQGTQSHLNFLPEKQTDFIFTLFAEEWGLLGGIVLLSLYLCIFLYGLLIAHRVRNQFGRLLVMGIVTNLFFYVFINVAMVMGLLPVVGVPLPLVSYGGTIMISTMFGFGLVLSASIHRDIRMNTNTY